MICRCSRCDMGGEQGPFHAWERSLCVDYARHRDLTEKWPVVREVVWVMHINVLDE